MEEIWNTFNGLFQTLHRQGRRVEELEQRVTELERRLREREAEESRPALRVVEPKQEVA